MNSKTVLVIAGPDYEDLELWYPKLRLEEAGYQTPIVGTGESIYHGKHGYPCKVDGHLRDYRSADIAGIVVPGGWAPDKLRRDPDILRTVRELNTAGKMIASICHGPWVLISAGILPGRKLTSTVGIRDDVINAGGEWIDQSAVIDKNLVTARVPKDLPDFCKAMLSFLGV